MRTEAATRPGAAAVMGPELAALAGRLPSPVVEARRITGLAYPGRVGHTVRLESADGTLSKGRLLESASHVERVVRLLAELDPSTYPAVLAHDGRALLERWVEAPSALDARDDPAVTHRLGATLAALHRTPIATVGRRADEWLDLDARTRAVTARLSSLAAAGLLDHHLRDALCAQVVRHRPASVVLGLTHHDLAPENVLRRPDGSLVIVDNEALDVRATGHDLARTWYRWPMGAAAWEAFHAGYATAAAVPEGETFWRIGVLTDVVTWRRTTGAGGEAVALARLRALADR